MQTNFSCCHGVLQSPVRWLCSPNDSPEVLLAPEEINSEDIGVRPKALQDVDTTPCIPRPPGRMGAAASSLGAIGGDRPRGTVGQEKSGPQLQKEKLQELIRGFAHDVVGTGLEVQVRSQELTCATGSSEELFEALLKMDRRLCRIELWPTTATGEVGPAIALPLQQVESFLKGSRGSQAGELPSTSFEACTLTVARRDDVDVELVFDAPATRDDAFRCLKIFMLSVVGVDSEPVKKAALTPMAEQEER
eukprot:TRINITY_DN74031_c0_g1_i1.p1 TRINITY_DN74031_c0_g1~~TRINITY_DN74031_c0_g1_i1.p1  ORF type:complete len:249 (-),score=52.59 TRINITY_DN74031_c0_g1_i1:32-778(-)